MSARASVRARLRARARVPRASPRRVRAVAAPRASPLDLVDPAFVVSRLAERALAHPRVLKRCDAVAVDVDADLARALALGELGSARVRGRGWSSPRDLTCRKIDLVARDVRVDARAAMAMRGVVMTRPARGEARLTLDGDDFTNFLRHPLARRAARDETFEFERGDVARDGAGGCLECAVVMRDGAARRTVRVRPGERSRVRASAEGDGDGDRALERALETFFERLVLDLDGTELRYRDMTIDARAPAPTVTFELDLCVKRFPSPGLRF